MIKTLFLSLCFLCIDLVGLVVIYRLLPDTAALTHAKVITRQNFSQTNKPILIRRSEKTYVPYKDIPETLKRSVLYLEDGRFFTHRGFDLFEIRMALSDTFLDGRRLRGASTISQQLVKNLYLSSDRTFARKALEALITLKLESSLEKWKILELYLNSIDWGKNIIGLKAAADYYFNKSAQELSPREAAFLAAIIPNPAVFGDSPDKIFVRKKMLKALEHLYRSGIISLEDYRQAIFEQLAPEADIPDLDEESTDEENFYE